MSSVIQRGRTQKKNEIEGERKYIFPSNETHFLKCCFFSILISLWSYITVHHCLVLTALNFWLCNIQINFFQENGKAHLESSALYSSQLLEAEWQQIEMGIGWKQHEVANITCRYFSQVQVLLYLYNSIAKNKKGFLMVPVHCTGTSNTSSSPVVLCYDTSTSTCCMLKRHPGHASKRRRSYR